ncbi:Endoplasmic reticulum metallopeptidase 1 [Rhizoclosmatium hyalinum]|nr:Endoplasmic reticulum metallopeptidase 1 [Rhizoclosmatium hyalinum]
MTSSLGDTWYESNNIVVRINPISPASSNGLLLNAHFDTQVVAPGVVDNSISVSVALELIRTLIYNAALERPLIINFNNGEELGMLGAGAMTLHPWFKSVKAFINTDGSGAAPGSRAMLFQTNSFPLMKAWKKYSPYPHASVIVNDLFSLIPSDTDYRIFVAYGHLQGVDVAFYSYRYQYHTPEDTVEFSWPISVQHLGDNIRATVIGITSSEVLDNLAPDNTTYENPMKDSLPIPDFVYYDLFWWLTVNSGASFRWMIVGILITATLWTVIKSAKEVYFIGRSRFLLRFVRPTVESYILTLFATSVALLGAYIFSKIKSYINPGSSYGLPILNAIWVSFWVFGCFAYIPKIWPQVGEELLLRQRSTRVNRTRNRQLRPLVVGETVGTHASQSLQSARQLSKGPPVEKWLPYGLLAFWTTLLIPTLLLSLRGFNGLFFIVHWSFYSLVAVGFTQLISPLALKWWREQGSLYFPTTNAPANVDVIHWHSKVVNFYQKQIWGVQLIISSLIPGLLTIDLVDQCVIAFPAVFGIPTKEAINDLLFAALFVLLFINLLPAFQMARKTQLAEFVLTVLLLPTLVYCTLVFPLSRNNPQQVSFEQTWDISTPTTALTSSVNITFRYGLATSHTVMKNSFESISGLTRSHLDCNLADSWCLFTNQNPQYLPVLPKRFKKPATELIDIEIQDPVEVFDGIYETRGVFRGVPESRVCSLKALRDGDDGSKFVAIFINPEADGEKSRWQIEGGEGRRVDSGRNNTVDGRPGVDEVTVLRRDFIGPAGDDETESGMVVPFAIKYQGKLRGLTVACFWMEEDGRSLFWETFKREKPLYVTFGPGEYGGVRVEKSLLV